MPTPILMPRQGQSVESCILVAWKVKPGDSVKSGDSIAEIETDKATFDVEAPADGTILEFFCEEGDDVPVLSHIGAIGEPGDDVSALRPSGGEQEATVADREPSEKIAASESAPPTESQRVSPQVTIASSTSSPRARQRAERQGVDLRTLAGTGPGGRVIERDVLAAAAAGGRMSPAARAAVRDGSGRAPRTGSGPGGMILKGDLLAKSASRIVPVKGVRKIIAERMMQSLATTAQLTLHRSFDATSMLAWRAQAKAAQQPGTPVPTINDLIAYAVAQTLPAHPDLNAHFLGDRIEQFEEVHLGIAVDTPRGLMVPVVPAADRMTLAELAATIRPLAQSCVEGGVNPDQLMGGTFTITNLGGLGVESFTPVLNAPEVAILGVGGLYLMPMREGNNIRLVDAIRLSLTIDHQAVDGAPGARFLQDVATALEDIDNLLSEDVKS